jgi:hypothetical protein
MKGRRVYFIFVALFFAALLDAYFWTHVFSGDNQLWCPTNNPRQIGCYSDFGLAATLAIGIIAVLAGLAARFVSRWKA